VTAMTALRLDCALDRPGFRGRFECDMDLRGVTVVFGPNGSGKTTLLRTLAGLEPWATGLIRVGKEAWLDSARKVVVPAHKRPVGMVFQDARLLSHLSVAGNLRFAERRARRGGPIINREDVVETFGIGDLLGRHPAELSGGERQRVAIARALLTRPRLLLMDEPLSALDIVRRAEVLSFVEQVPDRFGVPVIYVTHSIDEMARLADTLVLIDKGRFAAIGPVADVLARLDLPPLTGRFEAGTLIAGTVTRPDAGHGLTAIDIGGDELVVPRLDIAEGTGLRMRIRARDVAIAVTKPKGTSIRNILLAKVIEAAPEGDSAFAEVLLEVAGQAMRARITRASLDELEIKPGQPVYAMIKAVAIDRRLLR